MHWYLFLSEADSAPKAIVLPEELKQRKIKMTPSGIEPAPSGIVAHYLNQMSEDIIKFALLKTNFVILVGTQLDAQFLL